MGLELGKIIILPMPIWQRLLQRIGWIRPGMDFCKNHMSLWDGDYNRRVGAYDLDRGYDLKEEDYLLSWMCADPLSLGWEWKKVRSALFVTAIISGKMFDIFVGLAYRDRLFEAKHLI